MNNITVMITGATSGIGKATAEVLAKDKYRLVLCGRRQERLQELQKELSFQTEVYTLAFDVRERAEVQKAISSLPQEFKTIHILVNNAGNAHGMNLIQEGDTEDWDAMMDINVKGLLYVSKEVMPQMVERKGGHIINIGSIAAKEVYPKGSVYCASKHAVDAISKGMLQDLNPYGIKVTAIHPGLVETEFSLVRFKGDAERAEKVYEGMKPLTPEDVAEVIAFAIRQPAHVNISDLVLLPTAQAGATIVKRDFSGRE